MEGEDASVLFNECTKRVARCANDFTGKQLVTIAFAASKKRTVDSVLFDSIADNIAAKTDELNPQGLSNAAFAYATVRRRDPHPVRGRGARSAFEIEEF